MHRLLILLTTESNIIKAKKIANSLIQKKLASCISLKKIYSIYKWEGDVKETEEVEITIKSKPQSRDDLIDFLQKNSSYDIPQIIYKEFDTESKYNDWVLNST